MDLLCGRVVGQSWWRAWTAQSTAHSEAALALVFAALFPHLGAGERVPQAVPVLWNHPWKVLYLAEVSDVVVVWWAATVVGSSLLHHQSVEATQRQRQSAKSQARHRMQRVCASSENQCTFAE